MLKKRKSSDIPFISVIIPVEEETPFLKEALLKYSKQTYKNFEVLISSSFNLKSQFKFVKVIVDQKIKGDVSLKRNKISKFARGEIFVFNDDDVYVPKDYLANIVRIMTDEENVACCGPLLTPPNDKLMSKASGAVWESYLGSLGAGIYRSRKVNSRLVYDYPAANLIVRKSVFKKIGGFEKGLYPGEDTKFCLLILGYYKKGILYDPSLYAYHHRKTLFRNHLRQIGRYGTQRGWFSLSYPTTSFQIQYFFPSFLVLYTIFIFLYELYFYFIAGSFKPNVCLLPLIIYFILLLIDGLFISLRRNITIAFFAIFGIMFTHLYYGYKFIISFFKKLFTKALFYFK